MDSVGPRNHALDVGSDPDTKEQFFGDRTCRGMPDDTVYRELRKIDLTDRDAI